MSGKRPDGALLFIGDNKPSSFLRKLVDKAMACNQYGLFANTAVTSRRYHAI